MAKIGTAHIEIKPVLDEEALSAITDRIAEAVAEGIRRGQAPSFTINISGDIDPQSLAGRMDRMRHCPCRKENGGSGICGCSLSGTTITC